MATVKLTCPKCGQHYSVEIDPSLPYEDMTCQQCGGKIPISAAPPAPQTKPGEKPVHLQCPICKTIFAPPFDLETHIGGTNCPKCGSDLPLPLKKNIVDPDNPPPPPLSASEKRSSSGPPPPNASEKKICSGPPPAATFFFVCSVVSFIAGDIAVIFSNAALSSSLYWSGVSFILMAIYLKIQWK